VHVSFAVDHKGDKVLTTLSELVGHLGTLGVDGPRHFRSPSLAGRGRLIGSGAQFEVFEDKLGAMPNIVFKRVKVPDIYTKTAPLDHESRARLRLIEAEIKSLCDPVRRLNCNIVDLVCWGYDYPSSDLGLRIPVLVMEKARCSLADALENGCINGLGPKALEVYHHLSLDVASGLQTIHASHLAHGDLKPSNILVFEQDNQSIPYVAKLSDFGLCLELGDGTSSVLAYRGTEHWRPPEISASAAQSSEIDTMMFVKSDAYVYGLVTMSLFLSYGGGSRSTGMLQSSPTIASFVSEISKFALPECLLERLRSTLPHLLDAHPEFRPDVSPNLLCCDVDSYHQW
jgi:serine/threonine protein kinase